MIFFTVSRTKKLTNLSSVLTQQLRLFCKLLSRRWTLTLEALNLLCNLFCPQRNFTLLPDISTSPIVLPMQCWHAKLKVWIFWRVPESAMGLKPPRGLPDMYPICTSVCCISLCKGSRSGNRKNVSFYSLSKFVEIIWAVLVFWVIVHLVDLIFRTVFQKRIKFLVLCPWTFSWLFQRGLKKMGGGYVRPSFWFLSNELCDN